MIDRAVIDNYESVWKEIIENPDGSLNKEQVMKELHDFSILIGNISKIYTYMTGSIVSKPMVDAHIIIGLCEEQLQESYDRGYEDAMQDYKDL